MSKIAQNIKKIREKIGLTQSEFALSIGITQGTLSKMEKGTDVIQVETLESIANIYRVSMDWLILDKEIEWEKDIPTKSEVTQKVAKFYQNKADDLLRCA